MGYAIWPDLKDESVICQGKCEHKDCAEWRRMAEQVCIVCDKPIEAGDAYYSEDSRFVHAREIEEWYKKVAK